MLPPELIRKGHLDDFNLETLAEKSIGFPGAKIEQTIVFSIYSALAQKTTITEIHSFEELVKIRPLSIVMPEKIESLRRWAQDRTVSES